MWPTLEITTDETVFVNADVDSSSTGIFDSCRSVFLHQGKHTQNAADGCLSLPLIDQLAELADLRSGMFGAPQQLRRAQRHFLWVVFFLDAIATALLAQMFAKKLVSVRMQDAHVQRVPLHFHGTPDPSGRQAVVGSFHLHAAIQMHHAFSVIGSSGRVPGAVTISAVFLRGTWLRPGVWLCHECVCRPRF